MSFKLSIKYNSIVQTGGSHSPANNNFKGRSLAELLQQQQQQEEIPISQLNNLIVTRVHRGLNSWRILVCYDTKSSKTPVNYWDSYKIVYVKITKLRDILFQKNIIQQCNGTKKFHIIQLESKSNPFSFKIIDMTQELFTQYC